MRRKIFAAALLSALLAASPAAAYSKRDRSEPPPGQERAMELCNSHILEQLGRAVHSGGGPKEPTEEDAQAPTNCDHFWQNDGFIGNG